MPVENNFINTGGSTFSRKQKRSARKLGILAIIYAPSTVAALGGCHRKDIYVALSEVLSMGYCIGGHISN